MALVTVPSEAWDTSVGWSLVQPDQVLLQSPGSTLVLSRSSGRWIGEISIGIMSTSQDAQAVKAFIDELRGSANEFDIEMRDDAEIDGDPAVSVVSVTTTDGKASVGITSGVTGFKRGNMIRIGTKAYRVVADQQSSRVLLLPNVLPKTGDAITYKGAKMRVRLMEAPSLSYSDPNFTGPWTLRVTEA